jgi:hypothetical protein
MTPAEQIEAHKRRLEGQDIPEGIDPWDLLLGMIQGKYKLTPMQLKGIEIYLERVRPKLTAVAVGHLNSEGFAGLLDRAIERSKPLKMIELKSEPTTDNNVQHPADELKKPFAKLRRV